MRLRRAVAGLDEWAIRARSDSRSAEGPWQKPMEVANAIDQHPDHAAILSAWVRHDHAALERLAESSGPEKLPPVTLVVLADALSSRPSQSGFDVAIDVVRRGLREASAAAESIPSRDE